MKLLLCTLEYPPQIGGVASYYANLLAAWSPKSEWSVLDNGRGELLATRGPWRWWRSLLALWRQQADFIFVGQILPLGTAAWLLSIVKPLRFGVFLHGMDLSLALKTKRKRLLTRLILSKAELVVCANSRVQTLAWEFMPSLKQKTLLLHPAARLGQVDPIIKANWQERYQLAGKKVILSLGRLVRRKGFDQVIAALENLPATNWVYILAGDGPEAQNLRNLAAKSRVAQQIIFTGPVSETEKWSCLDLCDIFITTSRDLEGDFEGFGIVYLEANLLAKPVIAGRSGGVGDAVVDEENGLLVDPEDVSAISAAIQRLLTDDRLRFHLGATGKQRAEINFSWPQQADKLRQYLSLRLN